MSADIQTVIDAIKRQEAALTLPVFSKDIAWLCHNGSNEDLSAKGSVAQLTHLARGEAVGIQCNNIQ